MAGKSPAKRDTFSLLLGEVKHRIQTAQTRAMRAVNSELVRLYWDIGRIIDQRQKTAGWGSSVIPRLAAKLKNEMPEIKGFSERNIGRMIAFYREYAEAGAILPQPVAKLIVAARVPQPVTQISQAHLWAIPWAHHVILMDKVPDPGTRRWYMEQTLANGWSRNVLALQIEAQAHARHGKARSNFAMVLPEHQSDLVQQTLKDPYIFDFLTLAEPFQERELETELAEKTRMRSSQNKHNGGEVREATAPYDTGGVRTVDRPFEAANGADTPFGQRWGGGITTLTRDHLTALADGRTLALDVQNEYVLFVRSAGTGKSSKNKR